MRLSAVALCCFNVLFHCSELKSQSFLLLFFQGSVFPLFTFRFSTGIRLLELLKCCCEWLVWIVFLKEKYKRIDSFWNHYFKTEINYERTRKAMETNWNSFCELLWEDRCGEWCSVNFLLCEATLPVLTLLILLSSTVFALQCVTEINQRHDLGNTTANLVKMNVYMFVLL